jgi:hypothetical protein
MCDAVPALLLDHPQKRARTLGRLWLDLAHAIQTTAIRQHLVAQGLQFAIADPVELHPEIEDGKRNQLGAFAVAGSDKCHAALIKPGQNPKQLFL